MTYSELHGWGKDVLIAAGVPDAALDARLLLEAAGAAGKAGVRNRHDLIMKGGHPAAHDCESAYRGFIARRAAREPLQYITGVWEFMGLSFTVTPDVLIPRGDSEILAGTVLGDLRGDEKILDMCTGSGCILLSILHHSRGRHEATGADISAPALAGAGLNEKRLRQTAGMDGRARTPAPVTWVQSDLFANLAGDAGGAGLYDIIVANPPYIATGDLAGLMAEVRDHEPAMALDGGGDGLDFHRRIMDRAGGYLLPGGRLCLEIGHDQSDAVTAMMAAAGYTDISVTKDYAGYDRVVRGRRHV